MLNYQDAAALLAKARSDRKKLASNTHLHRIDEHTVAVKLHDTNIVLVNENGTYTLNSGGYRTVTTQARINDYSPARIHTHNNVWYLGNSTQRWANAYIFADGVIVGADGEPITETPDVKQTEKFKRILDKAVRAYIDGFAAWAVKQTREEDALPHPTGGDCWACFFTVKEEAKEEATPAPKNSWRGYPKRDLKKSEPMGVDHLIEHLRESYYVPSLLWKAIADQGYPRPEIAWFMIEANARHGQTDLLERTLVSYFRRRKPALLEIFHPDQLKPEND